MDLFGQIIQKVERSATEGQNIFTIELGKNISEGIYFLELTLPDGSSYSERIVHLTN